MICYKLKTTDSNKTRGSASAAGYAFLDLWHCIVFSRWLNENESAEGLFEACKYSILSTFFSLLISCESSRNKVWDWRISLSRSTYLISILPVLLLLRFIDQDDCMLCPLLDKSGRGKGSFAEMWVLRASPCHWLYCQLASSVQCSVIKNNKMNQMAPLLKGNSTLLWFPSSKVGTLT